MCPKFGGPVIPYKQKMLEVENRRTELNKQLKETELKGTLSESTLEQIKNVFLDGNTASEKYLSLTDYEKRKMLEKLLSNATFKNKNIVNYQFKKLFSPIANTPKNCDLPTLLGVWEDVGIKIYQLNTFSQTT